MRTAQRFVTALLALSVLACSSPNRGIWGGTFDGSVSGRVEFRINARGTSLTGSMEGETREGQPFTAEMEGRLNEDRFFYATFEGTSRAGALPVAFEGLMRGELDAGESEGDWTATLKMTGTELRGGWSAEQRDVP